MAGEWQYRNDSCLTFCDSCNLGLYIAAIEHPLKASSIPSSASSPVPCENSLEFLGGFWENIHFICENRTTCHGNTALCVASRGKNSASTDSAGDKMHRVCGTVSRMSVLNLVGQS